MYALACFLSALLGAAAQAERRPTLRGNANEFRKAGGIWGADRGNETSIAALMHMKIHDRPGQKTIVTAALGGLSTSPVYVPSPLGLFLRYLAPGTRPLAATHYGPIIAKCSSISGNSEGGTTSRQFSTPGSLPGLRRMSSVFR